MNFGAYLHDDVLPFWLNHAMDEECGGIFNYLDRDGSLYSDEKQVWFQGRALYIFSRAYREIEKNPRYLAAAESCYEFLPKCQDETGRLYFLARRDGAGMTPASDMFSESFAAIGCAEYYRITGDEEAKRRAEAYFDFCYGFTLRSENREASHPGEIRYRAQAPYMILLSMAQVFRPLNFDKYDALARECAAEILKHKTDMGLLENVGMDYAFVDTMKGREINPGHSLEAAWFLMSEGIAEKNEDLINKALQIVDISMKIGYQNEGIIAFADAKGCPNAALEWDMKIYWPQCEAIIANRLAYLLSGKNVYRKNCDDLTAFVFSHFADPAYGEWFGYLHADNTVSNRLKGNISKGLFHMPRMLLLMDQMSRLTPETVRKDAALF